MNEQPMPTERIFDDGAPRHGPVALVPGRELVAVLGLVILADMTIYRAQGFAGPAALFALAPLPLLWGAPERRIGADSWIVGTMLLVVAAAMAWCGGVEQLALGAMLLVAFGMTAAGMRAYVVDVLLFAFLTIVTGGAGLTRQLSSLNRVRPLVPRATWLKVVLPLAAVLGFGTLFVRANPDEATSIAD
ncbi:MAG TPA: hypothetical protein VGZ26_09295, partial [Pirellulales bacterium]|nr:hypothetical protein [Pirellulales bacterium]